MLDHIIRPYINPFLDCISKKLYQYNLTANHLTLSGLIFGLCAMVLLYFCMFLPALVFIILNRLCDGLDGTLARYHKNNSPITMSSDNDFGGFLDILCDFLFYSGIIFAVGLSNSNYTTSALFLIYSFIGTMVSFLAYAIIAAKHKIESNKHKQKSFYYLGGLCEGTETFIILVLICLFPSGFNTICIIYGIMCWLTTVSRTYCAWVDFS